MNHLVLGRSGYHSAVGGVGDAPQPTFVAAELAKLLTRRDIPQANGFVLAHCGQRFPIGREGHGAGRFLITLESAYLRTGIRSPKVDRLVRWILGGERLAVRREEKGGHSVFMEKKTILFLARGCIPKSNKTVGAASGKHLAIRREGDFHAESQGDAT